MKKLILLGVVILSLSSCRKKTEGESLRVNGYGHEFEVLVLDDCQYIRRYREFSHKGNCNNPIHCYNL